MEEKETIFVLQKAAWYLRRNPRYLDIVMRRRKRRRRRRRRRTPGGEGRSIQSLIKKEVDAGRHRRTRGVPTSQPSLLKRCFSVLVRAGFAIPRIQVTYIVYTLKRDGGSRGAESYADFEWFLTLKLVSDPCQSTNRKRTCKIDLFRPILCGIGKELSLWQRRTDGF